MGEIFDFTKAKKETLKEKTDDFLKAAKKQAERQKAIYKSLPDKPHAAIGKLWEMLCGDIEQLEMTVLTDKQYEHITDIIAILDDYVEAVYEDYYDDPEPEPSFKLDIENAFDYITDPVTFLSKWIAMFGEIKVHFDEYYKENNEYLVDCMGYLSLLQIKLWDLRDLVKEQSIDNQNKELLKESNRLYIRALNNVDRDDDYIRLAGSIINNPSEKMLDMESAASKRVDELIGNLSPIPAAAIKQLTDLSYEILKNLNRDNVAEFSPIISVLSARIASLVQENIDMEYADNDSVSYIDDGISYIDYMSITDSIYNNIKKSSPVTIDWGHHCLKFSSHLFSFQDISW